MSRLAKNLVASETGRRFIDVTPLSTITVKDSFITDVSGDAAYEYRLEARFGASTLVNKASAEQSSADANVFTDAIRAARRKIVEDVFGEFRPLIYQINEAIHARDWTEANNLTRKLYQQMFEEGV
jgi:hypothetical protein